jgi:transposase
MLNYQKLSKHQRSFKSLTGVSVQEFESLYAEFEPAWAAAEAERLMRPNRRRAVGGGRSYAMSLRTQLVMLLVWLRLYLTTEAIGVLFELDKSNVSRNLRRLLPVLRQISQEQFGWPEPPAKGQGKDLAQAIREYPDLVAISDATEQEIERPQRKEREKLYYSGKARCHTCKNSLVVNEHGLIRAVTQTTPGSVHDLTHLRQSGVLAQIPREVCVIADAGYDGLAKDLPYHSVATAHKAYRNHPLTEDHRLMNRQLSSVRIVVENVFAHIKHFRILAERFRHPVERWHSDIFCVIAAIVNRRTRCRLEQAA